MKDEGFCYVARNDTEPGAFAACADAPDYKKESAKFVAQQIRKGHIVDRVPTQQARDMLGEWCKFKQAQESGNIPFAANRRKRERRV